ncbi:hypothetical protein Hanom_Chr05g00413061 [Helianthus anomalus]
MQSKHKSFNNQKVKSNRSCYSEPVKAAKTEAMKNNNRKAKPSDYVWNAAKQRNQNYQDNFQRNKRKAFEN